ncbi:VOC family protein [Solirubrobacter ginsenosidimutans]|uniref:VOC family protein n=1 Tax=Solirubrobacter ginsenosidimutans TaxID=490573 RepID=A0A9X3RXY9_9ACTN|nr:VOC family protein [Solirubrobacter ginsenosidimutans]MDA0159060.1 VOC family protein [Solirubrobacter ginsenosidimutans]
MQVIPPVHHLGYVVDELRAGVEAFARDFGAGPFYAIEHVAFDEVTFDGAPAVYDHSSAFGAWGPILVELTQVHEAQPHGLERALTPAGAGLGHVAWLADDLDDEVRRLQAAGLRPFHTGRSGPVSAVWLEGAPFGHPVEVLQRVPELLGFYAMLREAADGWDGNDPFRLAPAPSPAV